MFVGPSFQLNRE